MFQDFFSNFSLIDEGGDWDRRNRLKVYRGIYCMSIRDFKQAATLFLDTVATFTSYELMDYQTFVTYTVICSMIALERPELREKVMLPHLLCGHVVKFLIYKKKISFYKRIFIFKFSCLIHFLYKVVILYNFMWISGTVMNEVYFKLKHYW